MSYYDRVRDRERSNAEHQAAREFKEKLKPKRTGFSEDGQVTVGQIKAALASLPDEWGVSFEVCGVETELSLQLYSFYTPPSLLVFRVSDDEVLKALKQRMEVE